MSELSANLRRALNPSTIAVVGDKRSLGFMWLNSLKTFTGELYSVQVDEREIAGIEALGIPNYSSLAEVPARLDYVICSVPRHIAPHIVKDCIASDVGGVTLFTSGFAETGEPEAVALQDQIEALARDTGLALIGPNCLGLHVPKLGVRFNIDQPHGIDGSVGFISQSGTHGMNFSLTGAANGVYCSKLISFGNGIVLEAADYLDYFAEDDDTRVIGMYIEGVRDGPRFARTLRSVAARKPVVIWKGGQTAAGSRATRSHTASLAADHMIWESLVRQAGAVSVDHLDEMVDVTKALLYTKPARGRRVGLMAMTGGQSVALTDAFAKAGWTVPRLSDESYAELGEFFNVIGGSFQNPLDMAGTIREDPTNLDRLLSIMDRDPNIDAIAMEISATFAAHRWERKPEELEQLLESLQRFGAYSAKPLVVVLHPAHVESLALDARKKLQARNIATFPSFERAANAMAKAQSAHDAAH